MVRCKTQEPVFNEKFHFEIGYRQALRSSLLLQVQHFDKYSRHHIIGQVLVALSELNIENGVDMWRRIRPSSQVRRENGNI